MAGLSLALFCTFLCLVFTEAAFLRNTRQTSTGLRLKDALLAPPIGWVELHRPEPTHVVHLRIGLKQSEEGIESIRKHLEISSDPLHSNYGLHLSAEEIDVLSSPSDESFFQVSEWLQEHGISRTEHRHSSSRDWITISVPVSLAEDMLNTTYRVYKHSGSSASLVRTTEYSLPESVYDHIDVIEPTIWFSNMRANRKGVIVKPMEVAASELPLLASGNISDVCTNPRNVSSLCLRTLYNTVNYVPRATNKNSIGVTGYLGEAANFADLQLWLSNQRPDAAGHNFSVALINGGQNPQNLSQQQIMDGVGIEANLDIQTVFGVTAPTPVTFFSTGGSPPFIADDATPEDTNEPYLEWLEFMLSQRSVPGVITTSYADDEQTVPKALAIRVCNDFMRLSARGVSLLFGSGDNGVGLDGACFSNDGKNTSTFLPMFPASCPFVTSVGGTQNFTPEVAVNDFFSGGGFSNYFARPSYQNQDVPAYLSSLADQSPDSSLFNAKGRGIPDVAAQGLDFIIVNQQRFIRVGGTSAATPLFASIVALLNDARLARGQPTLGFLNPLLYGRGRRGLTDITSGSSSGCDTNGFPAKDGWDAVTGLGTPDFEKLLKIVLA